MGGESVGIVDMLAMRKRHLSPPLDLKRGDLFDVILIQVKGGNARYPSFDELRRLQRVGRAYRARMVVFAQWTRGHEVRFFRLKRTFCEQAGPRAAWQELESIAEVFR
jgi:hypothetical protein